MDIKIECKVYLKSMVFKPKHSGVCILMVNWEVFYSIIFQK